MNAQTLFLMLKELHVEIYSKEGRIFIKGDNEVLATIVPILNLYKAVLQQYFAHEILEYTYIFNERAGIYEFESGLSTEDAEHQAMNEIVTLYSDQNKVSIYSTKAKQFINQFRTEVNYV
ncbi:MAG: hypothetical protein HON23_05875 [Rickettsiales bacterium]|jgi:hypothetical protein|nr:hypothetical protein [Rickettsiales bacterium]